MLAFRAEKTWIPAFAGMTKKEKTKKEKEKENRKNMGGTPTLRFWN